MRPALAAALALAVFAAPVRAAPADDFHRLMDEHYAWLLRESPTYATSLGVHDYDRQIEDLSLAAADRRTREAAAFLARLDAIPAAASPRASRATSSASA